MDTPTQTDAQKAMENAVACMNCKFFRPPADMDPDLVKQGIGNCYRYPPTTDHAMVALENGVPQFHRIIQIALTPMSGWCGEFIRRSLSSIGKMPPKVGRP